ncbi:hypothetical protein [Paraburkholderia phenazinium]|jgi:hypothetical protein|uniref:Uncharacterized protein n=1 Tax=Paraburkholderia phenazinium TaxID=60549 RepID=A0A1G7W2B1_9BURK|nr:hypothetical protein [Paraburkholderia phenazinium]SDG66152.1 hypothetical protein SAMN05216466_104371 [Paraburkholderia phenazinium]
MKLRHLITLLFSLAIGAAPALVNALASTDPDAAALFGGTKLTTVQQTSGTGTAAMSTASVGSEVLRGASGNVGVNVAAGALNAQANQVALVSSPAADVNTLQDAHATGSVSGRSTATLGAGALAHVSGNVGVNIVSGVGNVQSNAMVIH